MRVLTTILLIFHFNTLVQLNYLIIDMMKYDKTILHCLWYCPAAAKGHGLDDAMDFGLCIPWTLAGGGKRRTHVVSRHVCVGELLV